MKARDLGTVYAGILIVDVERGSLSHRAGVRGGDVLVTVNGQRVRCMADYALARPKYAHELVLVVIRDGVEIELRADLG